MKMSDQKEKIPTSDRSFDDRRRKRTLRRRGRYFFSCSSLGSHWRTVEILEFLNEEEEKEESQSSLKIQREVPSLSSPIRLL